MRVIDAGALRCSIFDDIRNASMLARRVARYSAATGFYRRAISRNYCCVDFRFHSERSPSRRHYYHDERR